MARDYIDDFLAADDEVASGCPFPAVPSARIGILSNERAKSSAELEQDEKRMFAQTHDIEFREPDCLTIRDYEHARALGLLSPEDEILVLADLITRIA